MVSWRELPRELRLHISAFLSLRDAYALQCAAPDVDLSRAFSSRVAHLRPLHLAWTNAPTPRLPSYRNASSFHSRDARASACPVTFSQQRRLALGRAALTSLSGVRELRDLVVLDVSSNALRLLDDELAYCTRLRVLNAGCNLLVAFPNVVLRLPYLHTLLLYDNAIVRLPTQWGGLPKIRRLGLYKCSLKGPVPDALCALLARHVEGGRGFRTANLSQNEFSDEEVRALFRNYPSLATCVAI